MLEGEREQIVAAGRRLARAGLVRGRAGNVSVRSGEVVAVTPTGARLVELTLAEVAVVGLDGSQHDGALVPTSELALHLAVYRRTAAGAVVHTHSPYATALACVADELPVVHYGLLELGGPVRVAPYATFGTEELAEQTVSALQGRQAVLMANHGALTVAADLARALEYAELLEWTAELYWRAAALGPPRTLDDAAGAAHLEAVRSRGYGTTKGAGKRT